MRLQHRGDRREPFVIHSIVAFTNSLDIGSKSKQSAAATKDLIYGFVKVIAKPKPPCKRRLSATSPRASSNSLTPAEYDYFVFTPASDLGLSGPHVRTIIRDKVTDITVTAMEPFHGEANVA